MISSTRTSKFEPVKRFELKICFITCLFCFYSFCLYFALRFWKYLVECLMEWGVKQNKKKTYYFRLASTILNSYSDYLHWIFFFFPEKIHFHGCIDHKKSLLNFITFFGIPDVPTLRIFTDRIGCLHLILCGPNRDELFSSPLVLLRNY